MSTEFIAAAASWFGMDPELVDGAMSTNANGVTLVFKVQLQADDYIGIADRMRAMRQTPQDDPDFEEVKSGFVHRPSVQEVMRDPVAYMDRPECEGLLHHATRVSTSTRSKVDAEYARRAESRAQAESKGAAGRTVQHIDVPEESQPEMPAAVWMDESDLNDMQKRMASDADLRDGTYLLQVAMLSPEQKAKYGVKE